jgi:uncharacterized damage-inducible protein DinB
MKKEQVEPWLRGTLLEADPLARGVLHALELAAEDVAKWCGGLSEEEMEARPYGVAPVGFHLRHIARSLDRLLSYAEGQALTQAQMAKLKTEMDGGGDSTSREATMLEFAEGLELAVERVRRFDPAHYGHARSVGRKKLPTTLGGLLVHCAEHTSRHVGQAVTTAKVVAALR